MLFLKITLFLGAILGFAFPVFANYNDFVGFSTETMILPWPDYTAHIWNAEYGGYIFGINLDWENNQVAGAVYRGSLGNAVPAIWGGNFLGVGFGSGTSTYSVYTANNISWPVLEYGQQFFVAVYKFQDNQSAWNAFFTSGGTAPNENYGVRNFFYGTSTRVELIETLTIEQCNNLDVVSGSLCRVAIFLFKPSQESLNQFIGLKDKLLAKPPFGYWTSIKGYLNNLNSTSTPAFILTAEISNITIFGTLRTALIWILWLFFGFWVIKRIARFDF